MKVEELCILYEEAECQDVDQPFDPIGRLLILARDVFSSMAGSSSSPDQSVKKLDWTTQLILRKVLNEILTYRGLDSIGNRSWSEDERKRKRAEIASQLREECGEPKDYLTYPNPFVSGMRRTTKPP